MEDWMLTDEEIEEANNRVCDEDGTRMDAATAVATAQADKMIRAGWKSPEEGWATALEYADNLGKARGQARQEALREVGAWLEKAYDAELPAINRYLIWPHELAALKSGRMPEGT